MAESGILLYQPLKDNQSAQCDWVIVEWLVKQNTCFINSAIDSVAPDREWLVRELAKSGNLLALLGYFTADVSLSHQTLRKTRWKTTWPENSGHGPGFTVYDSVYSTPYI